MQVAIMGAGLSGLACAITLEQNGIEPIIFEKKSRVADMFVYAEVILSLMDRPMGDAIAYFAEKHNIYLKPISNLKELIVHSRKQQARITGHLGFSNLRGRHEDAFGQQLAGQVRSKIIYNSNYTYQQLVREFSHVVVATGDPVEAIKQQQFRVDVTTTLKGAKVKGCFALTRVHAWLDYDLAPLGYCYLIPISESEADLIVAYPQYSGNAHYDNDQLLQKLVQRAEADLEQSLTVSDGFAVKDYVIGMARHPRIGNSFYVGNCLGAIQPFLGFGQVQALLTGVYAAHDLCGLGKYEQLVKPLQKAYENSLVLRRVVEKLSNEQLDLLVRSLNGAMGRRLFSTKYDALKLAGYVLRPFV